MHLQAVRHRVSRKIWGETESLCKRTRFQLVVDGVTDNCELDHREDCVLKTGTRSKVALIRKEGSYGRMGPRGRYLRMR